ncbi:MAG: hypothetical protein QOK17_325 [Sphingomonadales bacterium]|jgi:hypothetical protein|nr:hypothetical protein [Sphingomonadales bacterium]
MSVKIIQIGISLSTDSGTKEATLEGYAYLEAGFLKGTIPPGSGLTTAERTLLTALTFTGCPIAARTTDPELNPWLKTGGAYAGTRVLCTRAFNLRSEIVSEPIGDRIKMSLRAEVVGALPALCGIARPFQEVIRFREAGRLSGDFSLIFRTCEGDFSARATTEYHLNGVTSAPDVWRNITIESSLPEDSLIQVEQIDLFGSHEAAVADLRAKRRAWN